MIKEALQYIVNLSQPEWLELDGLTYTSKPIYPAVPSVPRPILA